MRATASGPERVPLTAPASSSQPLPSQVAVSRQGTQRIRNLHPGWFGAVMGTAVVGIIAANDPGRVSALAGILSPLAIGATALSALMLVLISAPYLARWVIYPKVAWAELRDPMRGPLHGTFPGGILVLAAAVARVGPQVLPLSSVPVVVVVLAVIGTPLALAISLLFAYLLFTLELPNVSVVNGAWFIPPVVTIIVPVVLVSLLGQVSGATARLLLFASYAFWGIGFLLFLLVLGLLHDRLVTLALPPAEMAPSLWIVLGPVGIGAAALLELAHAAPAVLGSTATVLAPITLVVASSLWGFGAWSLLVALALLGRYLSHGRIPYGVGWWAFTFPLGALTVATVALANAWSLPFLSAIALGLLIGLFALWAVVSAATLRSLLHGPTLRLPSSPAKTHAS